MLTLAKLYCATITAFSLSFLVYDQVTLATITLPLRTKKAMVVSAHPLASEAGISMLRKGGNAVDAAVATAFAISVVEPFAAGIGGGGFLLMHSEKTGEIKALDFRERAPLKATRNMYLDTQGKVRPNASTNGYLAVATPGVVAGLYEVHRRYGKLSWQEVVKPAITLAKDGFILSHEVSWRSVQSYANRKQAVLDNPVAKEIFTENGEFYQPGDQLIQRDLADSLKRIAKNPQSFYTGSIAQTIASDMEKNGGLITLADLKAYKPIWRNPLCGNFREAKICSMPPPSSGGVHLLQILNIIGDTDFKSLGWHHPDALHLIAEAMKIAYADRSQYIGDSDFVEVPVQQLISPAYAKKRRQEINMEVAKPSSEIKPVDKETLNQLTKLSPNSPRFTSFITNGESLRTRLLNHLSVTKYLTQHESSETSHLTVVDEQRNAVSLTFSINLGFGSGVIIPKTGILLNNHMDDFTSAPGMADSYGVIGNDINAITPRKTPRSSMTPTIITENGRLRMAVGTPGGTAIITQIVQIVLNVLEYKMDIGAAISASRIHHRWLPDELRVESWGFDAPTLQELRRRGHNIKETTPWGDANAIVVTEDGSLEGAADPRGEGSPRGF
jgi:gamma-glutamyltranspeptidase/glutathione hydrolase